jgi:hypothetical protein
VRWRGALDQERIVNLARMDRLRNRGGFLMTLGRLLKLPTLCGAAALAFAPYAAAAQTSSTPDRTAQHGGTAAGTLNEHVDRAEAIVDGLLDLNQAASTAERPNTLIAVHRSDLEKLRDALKGISSAAPTAQTDASARATLAAHITDAKRIADSLNGRAEKAEKNAGKDQTATAGTSGSTEAAAGANERGRTAKPAGRDKIVTVDKTKLRELKDQVEAIERLAPRS